MNLLLVVKNLAIFILVLDFISGRFQEFAPFFSNPSLPLLYSQLCHVFYATMGITKCVA